MHMGVARAYQGSGGQTLLAGLQGSSPFGYAGQYLDSGPGTYAMRARQYDPQQGRFQAEDPLPLQQRLPATINPFQYAFDEPTVLVDPSGQYIPWGTDCFYGRPIDGKGGVINPHDLAESAYLLLQGQHGNYRAACELRIPASSRNGAGPPGTPQLPFPGYEWLAATGRADVVDDPDGNGAALWELEPRHVPTWETDATTESLHYVHVAKHLTKRQCIAGIPATFRQLGVPGSPIYGGTLWYDKRDFVQGDPSHFLGGSAYVPPVPPAVGIDDRLYEVAIGPGSQLGALWFEVFRSKKKKTDMRNPGQAPSYAVLTNPAGEWDLVTKYSYYDNEQPTAQPVPQPLPPTVPLYYPNERVPLGSCGFDCAWRLAVGLAHLTGDGLIWVGTHPEQALLAAGTVVVSTGVVACTLAGPCGAAAAAAAAAAGLVVLGPAVVNALNPTTVDAIGSQAQGTPTPTPSSS
jgi:RHS repeat-associated protein